MTAPGPQILDSGRARQHNSNDEAELKNIRAAWTYGKWAEHQGG